MKNPREAFRETAADPRFQHAFRGYLAEDYDGIAQFVSVSLNRSSTNSALRARVPYGNAGSGGRFPTGTPLILYAHRGRVEVIHGLGLPKAIAIVERSPGPAIEAIDLFDRTDPALWGTPTRGAPDWAVTTNSVSGSPTPTTAISTDGLGNLSLTLPKPSGPSTGAQIEEELELNELRDGSVDKFTLEFDLTLAGLRGASGTQTINELDLGVLQTALGTDGICFQIRWFEFSTPPTRLNLMFRDQLGSTHGTYTSPGAYLSAPADWNDQHVTIDRDVARGTTRLILDGIGTVEVACSEALARASYPLSIRHTGERDSGTVPLDTLADITNVMSVDNIYLTTVE
jgi:hypothetical protein